MITISGTDARAIMGSEKAFEEWALIKLGKAAPEDLSWKIPVQIGSYTEPFNLALYAHKTQRQCFKIGEFQVAHAAKMKDHGFRVEYDMKRGDYNIINLKMPWQTGHLDGLCFNEDGELEVLEAKHTSEIDNFNAPEAVVERNYWQGAHYCMITNTRVCNFTVLYGTSRWMKHRVEYSTDALTTLLGREIEVRLALEGNEMPAFARTLDTPAIDRRKVYGEDEIRQLPCANEFISLAGTWLDNYEAADKAEKAEKAIKGLVPADAKSIRGFGISISISTDGKKSLRVDAPKKKKEAA